MRSVPLSDALIVYGRDVGFGELRLAYCPMVDKEWLDTRRLSDAQRRVIEGSESDLRRQCDFLLGNCQARSGIPSTAR